MLWQPVGLEESKRKSVWAMADFEGFEGQWLFYWPKKRRNMNRPDAFAADFLQVRQAVKIRVRLFAWVTDFPIRACVRVCAINER
ncbi:hypothetical protein SAMN05216428_11752 [Nitrosospira sp. Nsp11]|nr:hypothetical protein SAMN05216428_11752 [Nitrosospira sp. Nsp11]